MSTEKGLRKGVERRKGLDRELKMGTEIQGLDKGEMELSERVNYAMKRKKKDIHIKMRRDRQVEEGFEIKGNAQRSVEVEYWRVCKAYE